MKNRILKISILTMALVILMQVASFAALGKITLNTKTDKDEYKVGDKITVTIDWEKDVQAAGFTLKYDKDKLEFDSTTVGVNFYNADTAGEILFNWASFDGSNLKNVSFVLTAKAEGSTEILVQDAKGFADEAMDQATEYEYKNKTIKISKIEEVKPVVTLSSIAITKTPTKDTYSVGEKFDKAGMEITATYSDGTKKVVTDYTYSPVDTLKTTDIKVVISYTENGVTKTAEQKITVAEVKNNNNNSNTNTNTNTTQKPTDTNTTKQPTTTTNKKDNTTASGKMPQTGAENVVFVIALVAAVGTIGFVKYKKLSDI